MHVLARARPMQQNAAGAHASFVTFGPIAPETAGLGVNGHHSWTSTVKSNNLSRLLGRFVGVGFRSIARVDTPTYNTFINTHLLKRRGLPT